MYVNIIRNLYKYLGVSLTTWLFALPLLATQDHPLAVADTSSPRATLESCQAIKGELQSKEKPIISLAEDRAARRRLEEITNKAMHCLDMSKIPRERLDDFGEEAVILLQEILDRIEIPPYQDIPDANTVRTEELSQWTIPNTEITIAKVKEGPREGEWLFSPETVDHLWKFYNKIKALPYRPDAVWGSVGPLGGIYSYYLLLPEPSLPAEWVGDLPPWARAIYLEQPAWKWVGMVLVLLIGALVFALIFQASRRVEKRQDEDKTRASWFQLLPPLSGVALALLADNLIDEQINSVGTVDLVTENVLWGIALICSAWAIITLGGLVADAITRSPRFQIKDTDASLTNILSRVVSIVIALWVLLEGVDRLGLSLLPLLAGLGVGGLAIALAVRPTFENLIGGLILFIDKPVKVGDRCRFGEQLGDVEQIGLRSTRIRTLEDTIVTIPNAEFSQLQLENISKRKQWLYQTILALRYETNMERLRYVLAELRRMLVGHPKVAPQDLRVRFLQFGDYSLDIEVFVYIRANNRHEYYAIREDINLRIMDIVRGAGTDFAFPSQTTYFTRDTGLDADRGREAEAHVKEWRTKGRLPFPEFDERQILESEDTIDYPPKGSPHATSAKKRFSNR